MRAEAANNVHWDKRWPGPRAIVESRALLRPGPIMPCHCVLCLFWLLISEYLCFVWGPYIADWSGLTERRTSHIWFDTIQSWVHVLRFYLILHYLIIDRKSRTFHKTLNKSQNVGICPEKLTRKPRTTIHKRFDGGIFYILFMCNFAHKVRRRNHGWLVLCQALYCRSSD